MVVSLRLPCQQCSESKRYDITHPHLSFLVKTTMVIITRKLSMLGIREVTRRNLANSLDDQALSRYLPPLKSVAPAIVNVKMLLSTKVVVTKVQG